MSDKDPLISCLERIAEALERLGNGNRPTAPDITRPLDDYAGFNWESIDAEVIRRDEDGPTHVSYRGRLFTRRSPSNKFNPAIWYSSPDGKDAEGNVQYLRLITFKPVADAEPLPRKLSGEVKSNGHAPAPVEPSAPATQTIPQNAQAAAERVVQSYREQAAKDGLSDKAAAAILEDAGGDPVTALHRLPYFKAAKAAGLNFTTAADLFHQSGSDVQFALKALPKG